MMRVGELAKKTGLTVRTLHYYDELGLFTPSSRSHFGHRLYGAEDVKRLQQIVSLRHLGFSLREIQRCLDLPESSLAWLLPRHLARLKQQIEQQHWRLRMTAPIPDACGGDSVLERSGTGPMRTGVKRVSLSILEATIPEGERILGIIAAAASNCLEIGGC